MLNGPLRTQNIGVVGVAQIKLVSSRPATEADLDQQGLQLCEEHRQSMIASVEEKADVEPMHLILWQIWPGSSRVEGWPGVQDVDLDSMHMTVHNASDCVIVSLN